MGFTRRYLILKSYADFGRFLGIELQDPDFDLIKNASLMKQPLPKQLAEEATNFYSTTYEFILEKFGDQVKDLWAGFQYLDHPQSNQQCLPI